MWKERRVRGMAGEREASVGVITRVSGVSPISGIVYHKSELWVSKKMIVKKLLGQLLG